MAVLRCAVSQQSLLTDKFVGYGCNFYQVGGGCGLTAAFPSGGCRTDGRIAKYQNCGLDC
nr:MAG TPA: hypothetical protein [Caudoviricetes sp.]